MGKRSDRYPDFHDRTDKRSGTGAFTVGRGVIRLDAFMGRFIYVGGIGVLVSLFALFAFILMETLPLFKEADVEPRATWPTDVRNPLLVGIDEWNEYPFLLERNGDLVFHDLAGGRQPLRVPARLPDGTRVTSADYQQSDQVVALGLSDGRALLLEISYRAEFREDGSRSIVAEVVRDPPISFGTEGGPVVSIDVFASETRRVVAGIIAEKTGPTLGIAGLRRERDLFGVSEFQLEESTRPGNDMEGDPVQVLVGAEAESVVARTADGEVFHYNWRDGRWKLAQRFHPFGPDGPDPTSMGFLQGRVSLSFTGGDGQHVVHSLFRNPETGERSYGLTKTFPSFGNGATSFAASLRNKAFLLGDGRTLSLRYGTTADVRWETVTDVPLHNLLLGSRYDTIVATGPDGSIHLYDLEDPHPDAGFKAFFTRIWYEGQERPRFIWQSTGGTDDFEPKLSMLPIIVGTLKGTVYALVFAIPIALLAAVYTSQFLDARLKQWIKPGIEIMASLPSVVLGFLAALWLAPLIENKVPSVMLVLITIPVGSLLMGIAWNRLPERWRVYFPAGWEFVVVLPAVLLLSLAAWQLGPLLEAAAFRYTDPETGRTVADFRLWWESWTGSQFQQRNSLVVGFMMGFAVIPIIYTIAEDAISAVPRSLVSGSLALGASRWQTTARLILPAASAGIFSAVMIGLGRAVGETMIVVMATGNTPILDFGIFSGMRTLSANIAVELPEAPHGGSLYRTLFFGALLLFVMTFFINTVAEILRERLRNRYRILS